MNEQLKLINQTKLAKICGWSKSYLSQKLSGTKPMTEADRTKIKAGIDNIITQLQEVQL